MVRAFTVLTLILAVLALSIQPAAATTSRITLNSAVVLSASLTTVIVTGTIVCQDEAQIDIQIHQTRHRETTEAVAYRPEMPCTGQAEAWTLALTVQPDAGGGTTFKKGPADAAVIAYGADGNSFLFGFIQRVKLESEG
jgi:hypothetical protein